MRGPTRSGPGPWLAVALALLSLPVRAEDEASAPEWLAAPAGGLSIEQVPGLDLASLTLRLSPERVEASYLLMNAAETQRVVDVGFPIPSVQHPPTDTAGVAHAFSDAEVMQDGAPVDLHAVRIRVYMQDVDVTDILASAGLDLKPLASGDPALQPRDRRRAMEQVLIDAGIPVDPTGWSLAVEPVWRVEVPARSTTQVTLTYTPYPGHSVDQLPGDEELEDLAHLAAYCADEQKGLLEWVLAVWEERSEARRLALIADGMGEDDAELNAYAEIDLLDLSFRWPGGPWPSSYAKVNLTVDPGPGRAAFCVPATGDRAPPPPVYAEDGLYRVELEGLPSAGQIDLMFLR